jgi:hypothetical protein
MPSSAAAQIACDIQLALIISMSVEAAPGAFNVAFTSYSGWIPWPTDLAGTAPSAQEVTIMLRNAAVEAQDPGLP